LASEKEDYAKQLWIMCSRDMLFYINTFCFTYDPRLIPKSTVVPFITYEYQDVALDEIKSAIEAGRDFMIEKSRDMGASWMDLTVKQWFWMFRPYVSFRLLSRNEDLVDKAEDPDSLFWKVLFLFDKNHLPSFLRPEFNYTHLHLKNLDNNSTIDGCTTTSDAARGGRCTAMFVDEFAAVPDGDGMLSSTRDVTKCRAFNSTHKGAGTAFYRLSKGKIRKLVLHWSLHPEKAKGLYYALNGKLFIVDKDFKFPENYQFRLDGKLRSPWYDNECDRAAHPMEIAQELDMDPFASDFQFFDGEEIQRIEKENVRKPCLEGELEYDEDSLEPIGFVERKGGPLKLWFYLDSQGKVPLSIQCGGGVDISAGTGASNSTISIGDLLTREKIAEFADPWIKPESFAKMAIAIFTFFNNAFMVPDGAGTGRIFCDELLKLGYRNLYFRRNEEGLNKKVSDKPGVFLNPTEKKARLGAYRRSLKDGTFIQRSHEANQECLAYVYTTGNVIEHSSAANSPDPSGASANHGDRVIADALLEKCFEQLSSDTLIENKPQDMPQFCYAARKAERERKEKEKSYY